jgi:hypothetical protein
MSRAVALLFLAGGCISGNIVSGEVQEPPRIPYNQVDPRPGLVVITDTTTQLPMTFKVLVFEEPNETDTLVVRWFVDYYRNPAIQQQALRPPEPQNPNPGTRSGASFTLTLSMLEPNPEASPHLVEVIVSDRPFDDPGTVADRNRTLAADGLGDLMSWTVQVQGTASAKPVGTAQARLSLFDGAMKAPLAVDWLPLRSGFAPPSPRLPLPKWLLPSAEEAHVR